MDAVDRGQVSGSAAEIYEEFFIPALFQEWPLRVARAADIRAGQYVLDVACGTGLLARTIADQIGALVVGLDVNEGMLAVASKKAPHIEWRLGRAEALPFEDNQFDAVVCQFGLMFFEDRQKAVREMVRVLRPNGHLAVAVWASLDQSPGYSAMADLLLRLFGEQAAAGLRAPFVLGDQQALHSLFDGLADVQITTLPGTARFPSLDSWVYTEIKGWVLADKLDDAQFARLLEAARHELSVFVNGDGTVSFSAPAHIVSAVKG